MTEEPGIKSAIIVGAGPSGLLLALLLADLQPRPKITILDSAATLNTAPRATHYGAPAIKLFRKAGILEEIRRDGYMPINVCWRKLDGTRLAGLDWTSSLEGEVTEERLRGTEHDGITVYAVGRMCGLLERELKDRAGVSVSWGSKVVGLTKGTDEGDAFASVEIERDGVTETMSADYVFGTDGGNSTIRRLLFGRNFPGFSWDEQVVATNTQIDLDQFAWEDSNFIIHPEHWFMAARIGPDPDPKKNIWRISYGELPGLSNEELMARQEMKFEAMLPGHPKPDQYRVVNRSPYRVHQRCCESMRKGRVLLAADAAHLCNPFGGMGLTGGLADIGGLFRCLEGIHSGQADSNILSVWSEMQVKKWHEIINPISIGNIKRLFDQDPETALENDEFLKMLKKAETDVELSRQMQASAYDLIYDYSQHFRIGDKKMSSRI